MLLLRFGVLRKTEQAAAKQGKHIPLGWLSIAGRRSLAALGTLALCAGLLATLLLPELPENLLLLLLAVCRTARVFLGLAFGHFLRRENAM